MIRVRICTMRCRVESRTGAVTLVSRWLVDWLSPRHLSPVWLGPVSCSRSSNRTGSFPASGSRKRLTLSPTEDSRYGVVIAPDHTQNEETRPESVYSPAALPRVCRRATDAAFCGRAYPPHCRLC